MTITKRTKQIDAALLIEDLKKGGDWRHRRASVYFMAEAVRQGQVPLRMELPVIPQVFLQVAKDPKWEVRKAVADNLNCIIEDECTYSQIVSILKNDANAIVKKAIETTVERHLKSAKNKQQHRLISQYDQENQVRNKYGPEVVEVINELAEKQVNLIVGEFTHDLRSILTAIRSNVFTIVKEAEPAKLVFLEQQFEFLNHAISDFKSYSQPVNAVKENEDLGDLIKIAAEMAKLALQEQGYKLAHIKENITIERRIRAFVSRQPLILALNNLIKNAYESLLIDDNHVRLGEVKITAIKSDKTIQVRIDDNGMGLSADDLKILKSCIPGRKNKSKRNSTGFGFPLACKYIAAHEGTIDVESVENKGTTVIVTLPIARVTKK